MLWNPITRWLACKLNKATSFAPVPPRHEDEPNRRILLIHAHPCKDSYVAALADAVEVGAKEAGHSIRRCSLYERSPDCALTARERSVYFDNDAGTARLAEDVKKNLDDLHWADSVVFVYPTWWFNVPAILKGYFDRTLVPGPGGAWGFPQKDASGATGSGGLAPQLTNVKRVLGVSTYGAPRHLAFLAGDNGRNCISTGIRSLFDPWATCRWLGMYGMDDRSEEDRKAFLAHVQRVVREEF